MKNKIFLTGIFLILSFTLLPAESYPPEGWTTDLLGAIRESEETGKDLLLNFTGSDWCVWCHRLRDEVFSTDEFKSYADENLVLVFLDFPNGISQSEETVKQNQVIASMMGVEGFPTIWLMDSEQVPVVKTGYAQGGPETFISNLKEYRMELDEKTRKEYQTAIRDGIRNNIGTW
jgi:protein disulfide-isomerase